MIMIPQRTRLQHTHPDPPTPAERSRTQPRRQMSTVPRRVDELVGEFEYWPLEADPEALTIAQHRPPGYFE